MIVLVVHIDGIWAIEFECNPPVAAYANLPTIETLAFQWVEKKTGEVHISRACSGMQPAKYQSDSAFMLGLYAGFGTLQKVAFKPFMFEILNHLRSVTRGVTGVNYGRRITPQKPARFSASGAEGAKFFELLRSLNMICKLYRIAIVKFIWSSIAMYQKY